MDDVLSEVLVSMRLEGTVYFCDQLTSPWRKSFSDPAIASFHQVRRGGCWLRAGDSEHYLGPGDVVFLGAGVEHVLSSEEEGQVPDSVGPPTLLLCGYCEFSIEKDSPFQSLFPSVSIIRQVEIEDSPWLKASFDQLAAEYLSARPGARIVVKKLTEALVVELIRENFGQPGQTGFLRALNDKQLSQALQKLHLAPEKSWTLAQLAQEVGMSRATLARRFKELVGQPMFDYLTRLRMDRAKELLSDTVLPLYEVATRAGYQSDVAFAKVFTKRVGLTPTRFRKEARLLRA